MPKGVGAGPLKHRVDIQVPTLVSDTYGQTTRTYSTVYTKNAEISFVAGKVIQNALQTKEEITHMVRLRWFDGLRANMQLLFRGRIFNILYIENVEEKNQWYRLLCQEILTST